MVIRFLVVLECITRDGKDLFYTQYVYTEEH